MSTKKEHAATPAGLIVIVRSADEIARLWPNLIAIARPDQEVKLLLHREFADANGSAVIKWVSDGTSFEGIGKIAPSFSIEVVARTCAAIYPKCRQLSVWATSGQLLSVIKRLPGWENAIVVSCAISLAFLHGQSNAYE